MADNDGISDRKSPGFWFFTSDFERDMQILPLAAQGIWIRMMCWASDNEEHRGFLELPTGEPMTELDIAHRVGRPIKEVRPALDAMRRLGTFSEDSRGCIFSRRMARDTHISEVRKQAASKRASVIERAKDGTFAPANRRANEQQKPTVPVVSPGSGFGSGQVVRNSQNGNHKIATTIDDKTRWASPKDELISLMESAIGRRPEVKVVRDVCEVLEIRGAALAEYIADIRPRIGRLRSPPAEGFFLSQAKKWGSSETAPAPDPEKAEERTPQGRCSTCNGIGMVDGGYCKCRMGADLKALAERKKPPSNEGTKPEEEHKTHG